MLIQFWYRPEMVIKLIKCGQKFAAFLHFVGWLRSILMCILKVGITDSCNVLILLLWYQGWYICSLDKDIREMKVEKDGNGGEGNKGENIEHLAILKCWGWSNSMEIMGLGYGYKRYGLLEKL